MSERYLPRRTPEGMVFKTVPHGYDGVRPIWELHQDPDTRVTSGVMLFVRSGTSIEEAAEAVERMVRHREVQRRNRGEDGVGQSRL